ncbi:hypothetical protein [Comamonas koreensis]|uniref:Uncharacterized protein n=1 Tax=Comamonas koreensis TaxID=160825 RepID=A0AAW4XTK1_9BURK|nr:hypothetical protein [Comamonas koreensis]MCD2164725.1 hypothetical protein [Comamonas koreensis]
MQLPKPTSRLQTIGLILASVLLANILATWVLSANLSSGVYPSDADAIMIPIANNFLISLFILLLGATGALLPHQRFFWRLVSRVLVATAVLYSLALVASWCYPDHYLAAASFIPMLMVCIWALWLPSTKTRCNHNHLSA